MTIDPEFPAHPAGPPWSDDALAALHAGAYPPDVAADLRQRIGNDPEALTVLTALDLTVDRLSLLPPLPMPERFALRLDAAIAEESRARSVTRQHAAPTGPPAQRPPPRVQSNAGRSASGQFGPAMSAPPPVPQPSHIVRPQTSQPSLPVQPRRPSALPHPQPPPHPPAPGPEPGPASNVVPLAGRSRRNRLLGGLAAAAAVVAIGTVTASSIANSHRSTDAAAAAQSSVAAPSSPVAAPSPLSNGVGAPAPSGGRALELTPGRFQDAYPLITGKRTGPLADPGAFAGCLAANKIVSKNVLGVSLVDFEGKPASAIAVAAGPAHARIVVVGLSCGTGAKAFLVSETVVR